MSVYGAATGNVERLRQVLTAEPKLVILMAVFGSVAFSYRIVQGLGQSGWIVVAAAFVVVPQSESSDRQADSVACPLLRPRCSDWVPALLASSAPAAEHQVRTLALRMSR